MQERCEKRLKVVARREVHDTAGFPINGSMPSDTLDTLDLRSLGTCRTETEPRGIGKNRHRGGYRILILSAVDDDIVLLFRYVTVFRHTDYSIARYRCLINLACKSGCW